MIELMKSFNRLLTWRLLAQFVIIFVIAASLAGLPIKSIVSIGFCGVIASVLSLRGEEGDS